MKTKITLLIAILFVGFSVNSQTKLGTIDVDYIVAKMPQLKLVQERLKSYGLKLDSINNKKIKEYDSKIKAYNTDLKTLSEAAKKIRANEINILNQEISKFRQNGSKLMQLRKDDFMRPLYKKITELTAAIAKEKGYSQILTTNASNFAYLDEKHDITKLVLTKLGIKE
jgi:outer membrane protein